MLQFKLREPRRSTVREPRLIHHRGSFLYARTSGVENKLGIVNFPRTCNTPGTNNLAEQSENASVTILRAEDEITLELCLTMSPVTKY